MRDAKGLKGLHALRTMYSGKKRSIPRVQSSSYLDLYMLNKEKERLTKEDERLGMRNVGIKKRLEEIGMEMNKRQGRKTIAKPRKSLRSSMCTPKNGVNKEWKTMSLNY